MLDSALADGQLSMTEHRQRVGAATNAATLGELQELVADLQTASAAAPLGTPSAKLRSRRVLLAVAGLVVLAGGAIAVALLSHPGSSAHDASVPPSAQAQETRALAAEPTSPTPEDPAPVVVDPHQDLQSAEGLAHLIDAIRTRFGDTMGYELAVMPDGAMLARPDPTDERSKLVYTFHGGWGDPSTRSRSDTDDLTDLAAFDVAAAAAAMRNAPETLAIAPTDVAGSYLDVDYIAEPEPAGPGALELLVKVTTNTGANGWIYLDGASNVKRVEKPG